MTEHREPQTSNRVARLRPSHVQWHLDPGIIERTRTGEDVQPITAAATTGFSAHGGKTIANPRVIAIYWGRDWGSPATGMNAQAITMDQFFTTVMNSPYLDSLAEYSSGRGTFVGSTWVDHAASMPQTLSFDQMRQILFNWLMARMTPEIPQQSATLELIYVIFPPAEITLTDNNGQGGFCAYHWQGAFSPFFENMIFAVVDLSGGTSAVSHELVEGFTDPTGDGWFSDDDGSEIGDVCSSCGSQSLSVGGFAVAPYWLVNRNRCLQQSDLVTHPLAIVPDVVGMLPQPAEQALLAAGFVPQVHGVVDNFCNSIGQVYHQSPPAGTSLAQTSVVTIYVGVKPPHPCP